MSVIRNLSIKAALSFFGTVILVFAAATGSNAQSVNFEAPTYTIGNINGQDGWSKTGPYDMAVSGSFGKSGFGAQSFRISNATTSGSFGDMAFSKPNANEAGETSATNGGYSGGTRQNYFESTFSITTTTTSQQLGLLMSTSPDRGDGARMSYLRFEDYADGVHVFFDDYQDLAPFGTANGDNTNGCGINDDFFETDIATLSRTAPHTIKIAMYFIDGPRNDVVQIYVDGVLVHTGTSWEDYFRYCAEQIADNNTHTVDSMLFRTSGPAHPELNGGGFLIDNMNAVTSTDPTPTLVVDDDGQASTTDCNASNTAFTSIASAVLAADPGDTIRICPGTYSVPSMINLNKAGLTLVGIGARPVIQVASTISAPVFPGNHAFFITASNVTLDNLEIQKTDTANQNLIGVQGNNFTAKNNLIYGTAPITDWNTAGFVSRAFVVSNNPGFLLQNNTIHHLRQPAYISGSFGVQAGVITGNNVSGTKGWVIEGGKVTFTNNTFGEPQNQASDIALLNQPTLNPADYNLLAISSANDNADIDAQFPGGQHGRAISYVNSAAVGGGNGSDNANYNTIAAGVNGALIGGQVVATGTFSENVNVNKAVTLKGSFTTSGTMTGVSGSTISPGTSPGIINTGNFSLVSGSNLNIEINGTTPGTGHDQVNVTGTVSLGGANLNVSLGYTPLAGDQFVIINNDGADAVSGTFNSLPQGGLIYSGGYVFSIVYNGGSGNDVVLTTLALCNNVSIPTNITSLTGQAISVPVNVDDTTGNGLYSTDFWVTYNPAVLSYSSVTLGTVPGAAVLTVNQSSGLIKISVFNSSPFSGAGTLVNLNFTTIGLPGTSSPLTFSNNKFNEGTLCSNWSNGLVTILSGTISGTVTYGNVIGVPAAPRYVPDVTLNAVGSVNTSASTGPPTSNGQYTLSGMGAGAYTVTPSKSGGIAPGGLTITGFDSSQIAQHVVNLITLNATQLQVADVSGAGGVTSFDAALIARWAAGLSGYGSTGTWFFTPANRSYANVNSDYTGEDYVALLMGDVSGNWHQAITPARPAILDGEKPLAIEAPEVLAASGSTVTIPISIGDTSRSRIVSYQFDLRYNSSVIEPISEPVEVSGSLSDRMVVTANPTEPGVLRVVVFGSEPLVGSGELLKLRFNVIGPVESSTEITWENFIINEGDVSFRTGNGRLNVTASQSDSVISGRVLTPMGLGIRGARVTVRDVLGNERSVLTNGFGYFQISGLEMGETYTVSATSRRYRFSPQAVSLSGSAVNLDMIGQE